MVAGLEPAAVGLEHVDPVVAVGLGVAERHVGRVGRERVQVPGDLRKADRLAAGRVGRGVDPVDRAALLVFERGPSAGAAAGALLEVQDHVEPAAGRRVDQAHAVAAADRRAKRAARRAQVQAGRLDRQVAPAAGRVGEGDAPQAGQRRPGLDV